MQFLIGVAVGAATIWFSSVNKVRFSIYEEKQSIHKHIAKLCTSILFDNQNEDLHLEFEKYIYENIPVLSDKVTDLSLEFAKLLDNAADAELAEKYADLAICMKRDLHIDSFHKITGLLLTSPIPYWRKTIVKTLQKRNTQGQLK